MIASGSVVGGDVVRIKYGLPKLKMSSTHPSGSMSCSASEGKDPSWIQKHFTESLRIECGSYSWYIMPGLRRLSIRLMLPMSLLLRLEDPPRPQLPQRRCDGAAQPGEEARKARDSHYQRRGKIPQQQTPQRGSQRRCRGHERLPRAEDLATYLGRDEPLQQGGF